MELKQKKIKYYEKINDLAQKNENSEYWFSFFYNHRIQPCSETMEELIEFPKELYKDCNSCKCEECLKRFLEYEFETDENLIEGQMSFLD